MSGPVHSQEWCCDSWCYVNEACPIAKKSWLGIGFYFSYETCDLSWEMNVRPVWQQTTLHVWQMCTLYSLRVTMLQHAATCWVDGGFARRGAPSWWARQCSSWMSLDVYMVMCAKICVSLWWQQHVQYHISSCSNRSILLLWFVHLQFYHWLNFI